MSPLRWLPGAGDFCVSAGAFDGGFEDACGARGVLRGGGEGCAKEDGVAEGGVEEAVVARDGGDG